MSASVTLTIAVGGITPVAPVGWPLSACVAGWADAQAQRDAAEDAVFEIDMTIGSCST